MGGFCDVSVFWRLQKSKYIHRLHTYICTHQNDDDDNEDSNEEEVLIIMAFLGSE